MFVFFFKRAFFTRWWNEIDESKKEQVRQLVHNGQLEFVNGGWVMNDEAVTNYVSVINQMTEGHLFILDNFGVAPRVAWHIGNLFVFVIFIFSYFFF